MLTSNNLFSLIVGFILLFILSLIWPRTSLAAECGINIDPANPGGYPSPQSIAGVGWVRIEYKDCTTEYPPTESVEIYRGVLSGYKNAGIKVLLILDYLTYPEAAKNIEEFSKRVAFIDQELGGLVDAYQVWNEPDHCAQYCLDAPLFGEIAIELARQIPPSKIVLGGFAGGHPGYLVDANIPGSAYQAVGIHPYGQKVDGFWQDWPYGEMKEVISAYRSVARGKEVWLTEIGFDTANESPQPQYDNRSLQAEYLRRVFTSNIGADKILWFAWSDAMVSPFGITTSSRTPKSAYYEFFTHCGGTIPSTLDLLPAISPPGGQGCGGTGSMGQANQQLTIPLILQPDASKSLEDQLMENMIVDQGYEVSCAAPELGISPKALGLLMGYFDRNQNNPQGTDKLWLTAGSSIDVNFLMAEVPVYREGQRTSSTSKTESYEGFFGNNLINQEAEITTNAGVANNLLTPSLQCKIKMDNLTSIGAYCNMLENPNTCAMHEKISGTKYYLFSTSAQEPVAPSVLTAYRSAGLECDQLMGEWQSDYLITQDTFNELATAINNTPLDFGKLFRLAFLVISPQQDQDELELCFDTTTNRQDKFWFLRKVDDKTSTTACEQFTNYHGKNPPIVIALKIPTFATNSILSYPIYDSGTLTANIFDTIKNQPESEETIYAIKSYAENIKGQRQPRLDEAYRRQAQAKATEEEQAQLVINCSGTTACDGAHGAGTELTRALVNIINGNGNTCLPDTYNQPPASADEPLSDEKLQQILYDTDNPNPLESFEYASYIGSPAHYKYNPGQAFLAEHYNVMLNSYSLGVENWYWGLEVDRAEAERIQNNVDGEHMQQNLKAHLVAPLGTNLSYVETMLASMFSSESLKKLIETNELVDSAEITYQDGTTGPNKGNIARYLPILDTTLKYDAQAWTVEYPHADACSCEQTEVCLDVPRPTDLSKCVNKETFCETIVVDWPSGSNQEEKKIACVKGGVAFKDNYLENEQQMGFAIKGAKLGFFIRKIQLAITQMNSLNESYEYLTSCERVEDLFLGRCGGVPNKYSSDRDYTRTIRSEAPNSCIYRTMDIVVPSECALIKMVLDKAAQYDLDPKMLWGLIKIENPSFLNAVQGGQSVTDCVVNACGAVGPFQIVQGVCVQDRACMELEAKILGGVPEDYQDLVNMIKKFSRNVNPCDIEEALDWTVENLNSKKTHAQNLINNLPPNKEAWEYDLDCRLAGYHWGDVTCSPNVSTACKGQSYCQCACEETRDVGRYSLSSGGSFENIKSSCGL